MAGTEFLTGPRRLACRSANRAAFAPFGILVDAHDAAPEPINGGTTLRHADLARLDIRGEGDDGDPRLSLYVASARRFPLPIAKLEQHRRAAQVFVPLDRQPFVVVVAPGADAPEWDRVDAFLIAPGQAVVLHRGCWHHGLVALRDGDRFVVIEGGGYRRDTRECDAPAGIVLEAPSPA